MFTAVKDIWEMVKHDSRRNEIILTDDEAANGP